MNSKYDYGDAVVRSVPLFHVGLSPKGKRYVRAALGRGERREGIEVSSGSRGSIE